MPVEIRELHIEVNVKQAPGQQSSAAAAGTPRDADNMELVKQCVEEAIAIMNQKKER